MTRNCPIPSPISLILAINGCQLPPKSPISAQTLSGAALRSMRSVTLCSSVLGVAKYGKFFVAFDRGRNRRFADANRQPIRIVRVRGSREQAVVRAGPKQLLAAGD